MGKFIKKKDIWSLSLCTLAILGSSQVLADTLVPVTEKNYEFAESDLAFKNITKLVGSNQWFHFPGLTPLDNQTVVRMNRDTIYSGYVADLSQGGSITIPDVGKRYISIMVVQNDHYIDQVFSKPGTHEIDSQTDFAMIVARVQIDPNDPKDLKRVKDIQSKLKVTTGSKKEHVMPNYNMQQLVALREKLTQEGAKLGNQKNMQGAHGKVNPRMHMYGTAIGWGMLPDSEAQYFSYYSKGDVANPKNCSQATYQAPDIRGNGFYSLTVYNKQGYIAFDKAVLNKNNIEYNDDGSFTVNYGNCPKTAKNVMPVEQDWDVMMRIYKPNLVKTASYELPKPKVVSK
ncbi:DUF1254 domain-containing protein [Vibrio parahaemolyticus]|uniref:DUF1254 domain-containing protein n=1 Tax=Vibrio parahaemolyticus TaxID=670 RepID=UPI001B838295|nr:DUF1254 domain-containing protein [Vibrio parahaemolyticus]MCI9693022.1 DUF1254 domain-containing protein [Vibrio parahaemolyticus]MCI9707691.1 DUF1254 domain-containing protein [Vibrio parahaemolyticus]MCI9712708.1 DUF1254 domain-containing protein [Vibrio parahaemolyticus]MCR9721191.1 DUF1254 domain-containing protein [Vibrio parahaemolyticus]MCR9947713.1 DUF1254 domain-containing protein [Vibrio parahaemolyticus]